MGVCTCYFRCAEQAFPGGACHDEGSFRSDPGNDVHGLFHDGYPGRTFYHKYGYRQGVVFGLILYGIGSVAFHSERTIDVVQLLPLFLVCDRLWTNIFGDGQPIPT